MRSETPAPACKLAFVMALAMTGLFAAPAWAGPDNLRESLFGQHPAAGRSQSPPVARYVSQEGDVFVLDRSQNRPLLKFQDSPEVWALKPQPAPRGDIIYKNDLGEPVLRATRLGGLTLFTPDRPGGTAAALAGGGPALRLPVLGPQQLLERLAQASARATRAARRLIPFEADASPASSALVADAALVTSEAVIRMSKRPGGLALIARFSKVKLVEGHKPGASVQQGVMRITITPDDGLAGRPSSDRIMAAAGGR
ncbi:DUF4908 domain-containing protein [Phenylobacterium sp. 20VBR1]|uniref:DUF4908 domain-containing protein n=1 Tax=Phenylobacterium glaciei TaxID=2803784 RepID=A0A941HX59_9CAUL|nr:DUF4908 domain-containing protein [Phenylobacterium glaciei]MBR7621679.1 DUF4908 domain-containing protein [Phenylobacterium glaciei]